MTMTMEDKDSKGSNQVIDLPLVQLALTAVETTPEIGPCLSDNDMDDLVEGRVSGSEKEALFHHLNNCPNCFEEWYDAARCKEMARTYDPKRDGIGLTRKQKKITKKLRRTRPSPWLKACAYVGTAIVEFIYSRKKKFAFSAAVCLLLLLYVIIPPSVPTATAVIEQYLDRYPPLSQASFDRKLALPWQEAPGYRGIAPAEADAPRKLAFGAGLREGRRRLTEAKNSEKPPAFLTPAPDTGENANTWTTPPYSNFYRLGQWCAVMTAICALDAAEIAPDVWRAANRLTAQQHEDLKKIRSDNEYAEIAFKKTAAVIGLLKPKESATPSNRTCMTIGNEIQNLVYALGPSSDT